MTETGERWLDECAENALVLRRAATDPSRVSFAEAQVLIAVADRYEAVVRRFRLPDSV